MLNNDLVKIAATELQTMDSKEVVKVAGILRRMRNWFHGFLNGEYGAQVVDLREETRDIAKNISELSKSLKQLDDSIKDLDVGSYHTNLTQVRSLIPTFINNLTELQSTVQKADDGIPDVVKQTNVHDEPNKTAPEAKKETTTFQKYDEPKDMSSLGTWTGLSIKPGETWPRPSGLHRMKQEIKEAIKGQAPELKDAAINLMLRGDDEHNELIGRLKEAIINGRAVAFRAAPASKNQIKERGESDVHIIVETDEFLAPVPGKANDTIKLKARVVVRDSGDGEERALSWYGFDRSGGRAAIKVERVEQTTPPSDMTPAPEIISPEQQREYDRQEDAAAQAEAEAEAYQAYHDQYDDADDGTPLFRHASTKLRRKELNKIAAPGAIQLPKKFNKIGAVPFAQAAREAYKELFGSDPTAQTLGLIWAQAAMESGQNFNLMNNNVGYVKATDRWLGPGKFYTVIENAKENTSTGEATVHRGAKFRAFRTPKEGIKSYLEVLKSNWPESLQWKAAGLAVCDAAYLSENKYYTASMTKYAKGMDGLFDIFMSKIAPRLSPPLQNAPAQPPGKCPVFRSTRAEVGKELKGGKRNDPLAWPTKSLKYAWNGQLDVNPEAMQRIAPVQQINPSEEFMSAMRALVATDNQLTKVVRRSLEKKALPTTKVLVSVSSGNAIIKGEKINNTPALAEFARILSCALREEIEAKTAVHSNGNEFEVVCEVVGSPLVAGAAVQEISDSIANTFVSSVNGTLTKNSRDMQIGNIKVYAHLDKESVLPLFDMNNALKHHRLFNFAVVS